MDKVYICHKCSGELTTFTTGLYHCGCMSGYVRDWQTPVTVERAHAAQIEHTIESLVLYDAQGRYRRDQSRIVAELRLSALWYGARAPSWGDIDAARAWQ